MVIKFSAMPHSLWFLAIDFVCIVINFSFPFLTDDYSGHRKACVVILAACCPREFNLTHREHLIVYANSLLATLNTRSALAGKGLDTEASTDDDTPRTGATSLQINSVTPSMMFSHSQFSTVSQIVSIGISTANRLLFSLFPSSLDGERTCIIKTERRKPYDCVDGIKSA